MHSHTNIGCPARQRNRIIRSCYLICYRKPLDLETAQGPARDAQEAGTPVGCRKCCVLTADMLYMWFELADLSKSIMILAGSFVDQRLRHSSFHLFA